MFYDYRSSWTCMYKGFKYILMLQLCSFRPFSCGEVFRHNQSLILLVHGEMFLSPDNNDPLIKLCYWHSHIYSTMTVLMFSQRSAGDLPIIMQPVGNEEVCDEISHQTSCSWWSELVFALNDVAHSWINKWGLVDVSALFSFPVLFLIFSFSAVFSFLKPGLMCLNDSLSQSWKSQSEILISQLIQSRKPSKSRKPWSWNQRWIIMTTWIFKVFFFSIVICRSVTVADCVWTWKLMSNFSKVHWKLKTFQFQYFLGCKKFNYKIGAASHVFVLKFYCIVHQEVTAWCWNYIQYSIICWESWRH